MGPAAILAMRSAFSRPIRLGISSPNKMDRKVTMMTIIPVAILPAYRLQIGNFFDNGFEVLTEFFSGIKTRQYCDQRNTDLGGGEEQLRVLRQIKRSIRF